MRLYQLEQGLNYKLGNDTIPVGPPNLPANRTKKLKQQQFQLNQPDSGAGQGPMMQMPKSQIRQTPINRYDYRGGMARSMKQCINITNGQIRKRVMEQKKKISEVDKKAVDAAVQQALDSDIPMPMQRPKARPTKVPRPKARPTINIGSNPKTGATRGINPRDNYSPEDLKRLLMQSAMSEMEEGYYVMPNIDKERYTPMQGLEGPFQTRAGKPIYYDPKEGAYYDRDTDMYLTYDEFKALDEGYSPGDENEEGMVSNCCGAPIMDVYQGHGRCSDCKEMASAVNENVAVRRDGKTLSKGEKAKLQRQGVLMKEGARGLGSIDWPEEEMMQTATDAIRYGYSKNDSFSHLYSMYGDDHGKWLRANEDMILDVFSQYMDESISEANESVEDIIKRAMKELKRIDPQVIFRTRDMMKAVATIKQGNIAGALQDLVNGVDGPENQIQDVFNDTHDTLQRLINPKTDKEVDDEYWADVDDMKARNRVGETSNPIHRQRYAKALKSVTSKAFIEGEEKPYICVHAKKGKHECRAETSYAAAKKAAEHWGLKSTSGIDAHLAIDEGDGRKKGIHGKGHPMRKAQQAAIHANEDVNQQYADVLKSKNQIKINAFLSGLDSATATRLTGGKAQTSRISADGQSIGPSGDAYVHKPKKVSEGRMSMRQLASMDKDAARKIEAMVGPESKYSDMGDYQEALYNAARKLGLVKEAKVADRKYGESKLQDMRKSLKLDESTNANTVVAEYTRATLDRSYKTWKQVDEQITFIRSFVKEDIDVNAVAVMLRKMHEQEGLDHKMLVRENVDKLRQIVKDKSAMSIKFADGSMKVDMTTASIFLQVFDKVKEETQAKIVDKIQTKAGFLSMLELMYKKIG